MATITNNSRAIRTINVKVDGKVKALSIEPGVSVDAEPVKTASFEATVKAGKLKVEARKAEPKKSDDDK